MTPDFDPDRMARATALAEASDSPWPRSMYYEDGSYVGNVEWNETGPWTEIVGPVEPRGGPAGLVLRGGHEIARWGDVDRADMTFSIAKSYLSTLAGLAHGDGLLPNLDEPVRVRVPGPVFEGPHNGQVTWRHFLNMNSEWRGEIFGKSDQVDHYRQIGVGADNSRKGQERPMQTPGSHYEYNDVRVNALSFALMSLFRRPLPEVLRDRIMDPIGASRDWRWEGYESSWVEIDGRRMQSVPGGGHWGGGLFISAADHARFGQLILRDGVHEGRRLLPQGWMAQAVTPSPTLANYGFLWWLNRGPEANPALPARSFAAQGAGTHQIWIDPDHDVVVVLRWVAGDRAQEVLEAIVRAL
ncbi:serine hydrolase domain-containing protein [Marinibacterium profundimaris]|nr:serine hydrolase [Marinibacterium profundimaris]